MILIAELQHVQRKHENCDVAYEYGIFTCCQGRRTTDQKGAHFETLYY